MSTQRKRTVVCVDDDEINLMILIKSVEDAGYAVKSFSAGEAAWDYLTRHAGKVDIVLLDKMMPGLNGLELLKRIKGNAGMKLMPVIMQTGDVGVTQMREGLENGAFYYLTKPFHPEILTAILGSAANECSMREDMKSQMQAGHNEFMKLLSDGKFIVRTHDDARMLAATLSQAAVYPELVALGLMELLSNAIEHGNLEIGYQKKRKCLMSDSWAQELASRVQQFDYGDRAVKVMVENTPSGFDISIIDEGKGFDWRHYMYDDGAASLNEPNGRGIAKAMVMLDEVRYVGKGNEVRCHIGTPRAQTLPQNHWRTAGLLQ